MQNRKLKKEEMTVLVVDDFSAMRGKMIDMLSELGFSKLEEAEDGESALQRIAKGGVDLVISDWNMPHMMGIELLSAIRRSKQARDMLFMMVTAESERESAIEAVEAGANDFVVKPLSPEMMGKKLDEMLSKG